MPSARHRLEACVQHCARRAWSVAYGLLRNREDAFDAVQQAFVVAARKPDRIPADDPWPWFGVVVAHEARNLRRKKRPATNLPHGGDGVDPRDPDHGDPLGAYERAERRLRLREALDALPRPQREAIVLTHIAGLTHAAAAEALGIPRQTLSTHVQTGRARLARVLQRDPAGIGTALAVLPVTAPPGGWGVATDLWTRTAVGALGTGTAAVTTAAGGLALMSTKALLVLTVSAALGIGFLGGHVVSDPGEGGGGQAPTTPSQMLQAEADAPGDGPALSGAPALDEASAAALREENRVLRETVQRLTTETTRLRAAARDPAEAEEADTGAVFTFGAAGRLPAVREANWGEMAEASQAVTAAMLEILEHKRAGTKPPKATLLRVQENVERMRTYEYRTIDKIPSAAKHNGEFTHPITVANLLAAILADADAPLSEEQVARIQKLGSAFDEAFSSLRARYVADTPRVQRILDEYRLKGRFHEDLIAVLSEAQAAKVVNPRTSGIAGLDLYGPTLMILHTSPVLAGKTPDAIRTQLRAVLAKKLQLDEETATRLEAPLQSWIQQIEPLLEPVAQAQAAHYTYEQGALAGAATVALYARLLDELPLDEQGRTIILQDVAIYIPRLIRS